MRHTILYTLARIIVTCRRNDSPIAHIPHSRDFVARDDDATTTARLRIERIRRKGGDKKELPLFVRDSERVFDVKPRCDSTRRRYYANHCNPSRSTNTRGAYDFDVTQHVHGYIFLNSLR